jgi:serine/threonine protein kinase/beta-lactam-binding protein with PASTA domain
VELHARGAPLGFRGRFPPPPYHRDTVPDTSQRSDADVIGGRYRLLDEIGRGGMATVVRARDEVLEREVALKLLHGHLAGDATFLDRFRREARAAARLSHPNVVALYDWGEDDDGSYMVLELIEGPSLRDVLRIRGRLTPSEALALVGPAAAGLQAAHRVELVHRDVKPENVLLAEDGTVKVTDFGLARAAASSTQTFGADVIVGSPHYLPPEAVDGRPVDARSDVYSLGIMLYELLVGRPPFEGETPLATALQHTTSEVPAPSSLVPGIPRAVDEVVLTATAADPEDRYEDAGAFAAALSAAVPEGASPVDLRDGRRDTILLPVDATETMVPGRTTTVPRRRAAGVPAPSTATGVFGSNGELDGDEEPRRPRRGRRRFLVGLLLLVLAGLGSLLLYDQVVAPLTPVPDVLRADVASATTQLEEAGFAVSVDSNGVYSVEVPEDHVVRQSRTGEARRGAEVVLTLSLGPRSVPLPVLRGEPEEAAAEQLRTDGLEVEVRRAFDEEVPAGEVIGTEPGAGETVDEGSQVVLVVSQGRQPIEVADVVGRPGDEAVAALEEQGLRAVVVDRVHHESAPEGTVLSMTPPAGEIRYRGDQVELVLSRGPAPFEVPDVRGEREDDARRILEQLGLRVEVIHVDTLFVPRRGRVQEQDPSPGRTVRRGELVRLYVWR